VKAGWKKETIASVSELVSTGPFGSILHKGDYTTSGVPIVNPMHLVGGRIVPSEHQTLSPDIASRLQSYRLQSGDIVIARRGEIGRCALVRPENEGWICGTGSFFVRPLPSVSSEFLCELIGSPKYRETLAALSAGATIQNISNSALRELAIDLPSLEEQQQIVAVLDEAFEGLARARAHAEANLRDARELFASALAVSFGGDASDWEEYVLSDLGTIQTGSTPPTAEVGMSGDFVPFVKPGDFLPDGSLRYDNNGLSQKGASVSRLIKAGSALMVCIGATIGKAGFTDRQIATNQQINSITPKEGVSGEYLYYQMLTPEFQASVIHRSGQATLPIINKSKWSNLRVKLPKQRSKQIEIVEKLALIRSQVDGLLACYQVKLAQIDALRQSLLQRAFAGELT
jgi:type I restriction enzyme S subunit